LDTPDVTQGRDFPLKFRSLITLQNGTTPYVGKNPSQFRSHGRRLLGAQRTDVVTSAVVVSDMHDVVETTVGLPPFVDEVDEETLEQLIGDDGLELGFELLSCLGLTNWTTFDSLPN
jgi:hypothetical protein